ncbi:MAG: hypothetical protein KIT33_15130 [Candidatus Kapabacteria bacterium]|nr:hypothetical protein [Ignavibacteriota bacterium]MCW5886302.1 hypothetical protein [Candidatus Kapabacteria bacterium]
MKDKLSTNVHSEQVAPPDAKPLLSAVPSVCLAWATKKRHIAVNGEVLCEASSKSGGYSVKNGSYNSIALSGLPTYEKHCDDKKGSHGDGIIDFERLDKQKWEISTKSICSKCLKMYERELARHDR